jgi:plasmid stability protein
MAKLTIRNIPEGVMRRLEARAAQHRRSLNAEVIHLLDSTTRAIDVEEELARSRARRPIPETVRITQRELNAWKRAGRM